MFCFNAIARFLISLLVLFLFLFLVFNFIIYMLIPYLRVCLLANRCNEFSATKYQQTMRYVCGVCMQIIRNISVTANARRILYAKAQYAHVAACAVLYTFTYIYICKNMCVYACASCHCFVAIAVNLVLVPFSAKQNGN